MEDIVVVGAGGFAKEVVFFIEEINKEKKKYNILGFVDNELGKQNGKYQVIGNDDWLLNYKKTINVLIAVGTPNLIEILYKRHKNNNFIKFPNLIHPNVIGDFDNIKIGIGNIICPGNIFTTNVKIGSFNIFNINSTIGHDSIFGNFNVINPSTSISGGVYIENNIYIGTGARILQSLSIVSNTIIGAGSVVIKHITEKGTYVGLPAKKIN